MRRATLGLILAGAITPLAAGEPGVPPPPAEPLPRRADGFESGKLAVFWLPGDYGSGLYEPGTVAISEDFARAGKRSAKLTVKKGDVERLGDDGQKVERTELDSGHLPLLGRDAWYGFSLLLPADFPIVANRLVIAQVKQSDVEGSPLIGQRFRNGLHYLTIRPPGASGSGRRYAMPKLPLGRWFDMIFHVRYSPDADGRIEIWMDGKRVVAYEGPTASKAAADRFYHKAGLYRDRWEQPMTMYLDNYTLGNSFEEVDPARFGRRP
jgi:hypothetical protein